MHIFSESWDDEDRETAEFKQKVRKKIKICVLQTQTKRTVSTHITAGCL
jgi:hypothetical protein